MTISKGGVSRCGLCRFYTHQGRRGGVCEQLNVPVAARWNACELAASPFRSEYRKAVAIASTSERWQVPKTACELVANPTVSSTAVSSTSISSTGVNATGVN